MTAETQAEQDKSLTLTNQQIASLPIAFPEAQASCDQNLAHPPGQLPEPASYPEHHAVPYNDSETRSTTEKKIDAASIDVNKEGSGEITEPPSNTG